MRIPKYNQYSHDFKLFVVRKFLRAKSGPDGHTISLCGFAKRWNIPKSTLYNWVKEYTMSGFNKDVLKDRRLGKKTGRNAHLRKITPELESIVRFYKTNFNLGCWIISDIVSAFHGTKVSHQLIWKIEKKLGLNKKNKRTRYKRFRADAPDDLWQIDIVGPKQLVDGRLYVITVTEDYSRYTWIKAFSSPPHEGDVLQFLDEIICEENRQPFAILTDNGSVFGKRFDKWCALRKERDRERRKIQEEYLKSDAKVNSWWILLRYGGILHIHGRPRHPQTQGKVERENEELNKAIRSCVTIADCEMKLKEMIKILNYYRRVREYRETPARMYGKSEYPKLKVPLEIVGVR